MPFNVYSVMTDSIAADKNLQSNIDKTKNTLLIIDNLTLETEDESIKLESKNRKDIVTQIHDDLFRIQQTHHIARNEIFKELKQTVSKINEDVKQSRFHLHEITEAVKNYQNSPEAQRKRLIIRSPSIEGEDIELETDIDSEINQISIDIEHIEELFNNVEIDINNTQNKISFIPTQE